jgi:hypothetical protein
LIFNISSADYIVKKTLACPSVFLLKKAPLDQGESGMDLTLYSIANNCLIISRKDKVEAIGYDPSSSKEIFQQIIHQKTGKKFFIFRDNIMVEQSGKKNIFRF